MSNRRKIPGRNKIKKITHRNKTNTFLGTFEKNAYETFELKK